MPYVAAPHHPIARDLRAEVLDSFVVNWTCPPAGVQVKTSPSVPSLPVHTTRSPETCGWLSYLTFEVSWVVKYASEAAPGAG